MTILQARLLQKNYAVNDGHRETAKLIVDSLVDLGVAAGYFKRKEAPDRRPETEQAAVVVPETIIPELQAAVEATMLAKGWQPPN